MKISIYIHHECQYYLSDYTQKSHCNKQYHLPHIYIYDYSAIAHNPSILSEVTCQLKKCPSTKISPRSFIESPVSMYMYLLFLHLCLNHSFNLFWPNQIDSYQNILRQLNIVKISSTSYLEFEKSQIQQHHLN